ncbi:MAG TPA: VOC family protein [Pseudonocardiaceae bacterium]|nr:VOC family protein [Pseudonocardiaceae bacterium]
MPEFLSAVIVVSEQPDRLAAFYQDVLAVPLAPEQHDDDLPHWGATLGQLHFAIHDVRDFPEHRATGAGSIVLALAVDDLDELLAAMAERGVPPLYPPKDLGWTRMSAVRDPDGNLVELTQMADSWWARLDRRRADGHDPVERWRRRTAQS